MHNTETKPTAIVVNDDPTQLGILTGLLTKTGIEAQAFADAETALASMDPARPPDLIVTDLYMPGIDGWRFCRLLRSPEYAAFNETPILVISATFAGDHPERIAMDVGADAFLPSPVDGKTFMGQARSLLTGKESRLLPKVLIVEDSKLLAGLLKKTFATHGYMADVALSAREAEAAFARTIYNLAVLDYYLPDGTGDVLLDAFRKQRPECVCLMMTAESSPELALSWMKRGAAAYLRKPFDPELLIELCARAQRERALLRTEDLLEERTRELRESEERYKLFFEAINDAAFVHEVDEQGQPGRFLACNEAACQRLGYKRDELLALTPRDITDPVEYERLAGPQSELARIGNVLVESLHIAKDGKRIPVEGNVRRISYFGNPAALSISRDITERKQAEDRQRLAREEWERTFNAIPDLICILDTEHRIIRANAAMAKRMGISPAETEGLTCYQWVHGTHCPPSFCPHTLLLHDHQEHTVEIHEDRSGKDFLVSCTPLRNQAGLLLGSVHVARDITERKQAEKALLASSSRLASLVESLQSGLLFVDADHRVRFVNKAFSTLFNIPSREVLVGMDCRVSAEQGKEAFADPVGFLAGIERAMAGKAEIRNESLPLADGRVVERDYIPMQEDQTSLGHLWHYRDITARVRQQSIHAARLHLMEFASEHSLDEFIAEVLNQAEQLTRSRIAFYHFVNADQSTLSLQQWSTRTKDEFCRAEAKGRHYPIHEAGVWVDCVHQRKPVIHNDYPSLPHRRGLPEGHAPVIRELVVPVIRGERIEAILGVGNKSDNYTEEDVQTVLQLADSAWDIIGRKHAEMALRESEERLRSIIAVSNTGAWEYHRNTDYLWCSPEYFTMLGHSPGRFVMDGRSNLKENWVDLIHPDDRLQASERFATYLRGGSEGMYENFFRLRCANGEWAWIWSRGKTLRTPDGRLTDVTVGTHINVTENRLAEETIKENESRLRAITDSAQDGIIMMNSDGIISFWNPAAERIFGYGKDEAVGKDLHLLLAPTHLHSIHKAAFATFAKTGQGTALNKTVEFPGLRKDGSQISVELSMVAIEKPDGWHAVGIVRDITDRKLAEAALAHSSALLNAAIDQTPAGMLIADAPDVKILMANPAALAIRGVSAEALVNIPLEMHSRNWLTFWPDGTPVSPEDLPLSRAVLKGEIVANEEVIIRRNDGDHRHVLANAAPVRNAQGEIVAGIVVFSDVTELKKAEEEKEKLQIQLIQAQKMESVGRLAGGVAHDFNNMLGAILGYSELALEKTAPSDPLASYLQQIHKAAERSADLTRQLLTFARKQTVMPKVLDLNETVESMLKLLRRLIGENIDLVWLPGRELWPIKMDQSQIDQILANLCVNARDAITGVGKVTIETSNIEVKTEDYPRNVRFLPGDYVQLTVGDTGCGMDAETLSRIFEPFFTTKAVGRGTGLGLPSVYGAVAQNNGFVDVASEPGRGSIFRIHLPRHDDSIGQNVEKRQPQAARGGETILLVEDEPIILRLTKTMLEQLGYTVLAAQTPGEAIALTREHSGLIDLLMTDVVMPEMNGRDLAEKLKNLSHDMKCLFMSGYTADIIIDHGVLEESVHFLQKPFLLYELATKIRETLKERECEEREKTGQHTKGDS